MNGGAVAYLTHSQYGRNRNEISHNNTFENRSFITGGSAGRPYDDTTDDDTTYEYNTTQGMLASTTGNIYGVYDLSGGAYEHTANWATLSYECVWNGSAQDGTVCFETNGVSDRTKTASYVYCDPECYLGEPLSSLEVACQIGDAIKEIAINTYDYWTQIENWFGDSGQYVFQDYPYSRRGYSGLFDSQCYIGGDPGGLTSFRTICIP